jgi:hypothetical protein
MPDHVTGAADSLSNKPVYLSSVIGAGTALIGNSQSAQVWHRGGLSVEATKLTCFELHSEPLRDPGGAPLGLTVFRPDGFVEARIS